MDQDDAGVSCPSCQSAAIERRLSVFAAHTRGATGATAEVATPAASTCGGGCAGCGCGSRN
jgi:hypothetical protein